MRRVASRRARAPARRLARNPRNHPPHADIYVNSDDCWALANRTADGRQIANPDKFPDGFKAVADEIHSLGMLSGLYTAEAPLTCAKFAASCDHEFQDAAQWAACASIAHLAAGNCDPLNPNPRRPLHKPKHPSPTRGH